MDMRLELVIVPVTDVDRAKAFYEKAGFAVDVDHRVGDAFRVVQLTPPGSPCSITIGKGVSRSTPGSYSGLHLVVADIVAARDNLVAKGIDVGEIFHFGPEGQTPGAHPARGKYESFAELTDPDGNGWILQEVGPAEPGS